MRYVVLVGLMFFVPWLPPVEGPPERRFEPPASPYGPGHRGVDFPAPAGSPVRSAAAGTVIFAGAVAGALHVAVSHPGGFRTTYGYLASVTVRAGERVEAGSTLGTAGGTGPGHDGSVVHFGMRTDDGYVDPAPYLGLGSRRVRLAPLDDEDAPSPACRPAGKGHGRDGYTDRHPVSAGNPHARFPSVIAPVTARQAGGGTTEGQGDEEPWPSSR